MKPKVIHPVKVILHHREETVTDPEFGVTGEIVWAEPVELRGQVKYEKFEGLAPVPDGNDPVNYGHIVFYSDDWKASGGVIGDELELEDSSRLIVIEIRPAAHYHGKFYHVTFIFQGRGHDMSKLTGDWGKITNILNPDKLQSEMKKCIAKIGNYGVSEVKKGIQSGSPGGQAFKPLSPLTIAQKGSSSPLIDNSDLLGSVNYQLIDDKEGVFIGVKKGAKRKDKKDAVQIAAVHEFGCTIKVIPEMRAYLHYQGIHLKKETTHIHIPARPFLRPVFQSPDFQTMVSQILLGALRGVFKL